MGGRYEFLAVAVLVCSTAILFAATLYAIKCLLDIARSVPPISEATVVVTMARALMIILFVLISLLLLLVADVATSVARREAP